MGIKLTDKELEDLTQSLPVGGEHARYHWFLSFVFYVLLALEGKGKKNFS